MKRVVLGERIDHGVGVAPAGLRGDGVVLREDFETRAIKIDRADFAAVLGIGHDERDFAVAQALDVEQLLENVIDDKAGCLVGVRSLFLAADGFAVALEIQRELRVVACRLDFENCISGVFFRHDFEPSGKGEHPLQFLAGFGRAIEGFDDKRRIVNGSFNDICMLDLGVGEIDEEGDEEERGDFSHVWTACWLVMLYGLVKSKRIRIAFCD